MPYETVVPPVPTRDEELAYIAKLEKEFLSQSNLKFYMNEGLRTKKILDSNNINYVRRNWWIHFSMGAIITGLFVFPIGKIFHRFRSGVPHYYRNKMYFVDFDAYNQGRNLKALQYQLPLWFILSSLYAFYFTDFSKLDDEYFENVKVLPMFEPGKTVEAANIGARSYQSK